jgi:hypothetical protein
LYRLQVYSKQTAPSSEFLSFFEGKLPWEGVKRIFTQNWHAIVSKRFNWCAEKSSTLHKFTGVLSMRSCSRRCFVNEKLLPMDADARYLRQTFHRKRLRRQERFALVTEL